VNRASCKTRAIGRHSPAEGSGVTIRIRYRILNARLAAGAVSAGQGGGVAYDGWRVVSQIEFQQWVESGHSLKPISELTPIRGLASVVPIPLWLVLAYAVGNSWRYSDLVAITNASPQAANELVGRNTSSRSGGT
jgi:hypothetical protein